MAFDRLQVTFPVASLTVVPPHDLHETGEAWLLRVATANDVTPQTRADLRVLWNFATREVHPPSRWKHTLAVKPGEPDMEEVDRWQAWRQHTLATVNLLAHSDCCLAHGCIREDSYCPILKHFILQKNRCSLCPTDEEIEAGYFSDVEVAILEEWNIIDASHSAIFDEAIIR